MCRICCPGSGLLGCLPLRLQCLPPSTAHHPWPRPCEAIKVVALPPGDEREPPYSDSQATSEIRYDVLGYLWKSSLLEESIWFSNGYQDRSSVSLQVRSRSAMRRHLMPSMAAPPSSRSLSTSTAPLRTSPPISSPSVTGSCTPKTRDSCPTPSREQTLFSTIRPSMTRRNVSWTASDSVRWRVKPYPFSQPSGA